MGCGSSSPSKVYQLEAAKAIEANRDLMRGLRLTTKQMETLYTVHLRLCEYDAPGTQAGELDVSGMLAGCQIDDDSAYLKRLFEIFDTDGSGELGYREFVLGIWSLLSLEEGDLASFTFWLYDMDYNGHLELDELMTIVNDVHGGGHKNPNGRAHKTPHYARAVQHFKMFSKKKHKAHGEKAFVTSGEFIDFSKSTPSLLWPAFRLQSDLHEALVSKKFWKDISKRRAQARLSTLAWMKRLKALANRQDPEGVRRKLIITDKSKGGVVRVAKPRPAAGAGAGAGAGSATQQSDAPPPPPDDDGPPPPPPDE